MLPGTGFYVRRDDFLDICQQDSALIAALRVLEVKTDKCIDMLRELLSIPGNMNPPEELLWLDLKYKDFENLTVHERRRTSFERVLTDTPANKNYITLQKLGFARSRFVAYADNADYTRSSLVKFTVTNQAFIVVMDAQGRYLNEQGQLRIAALDGFGKVSKQYLYEIDAVNAAIYRLRGAQPPPPLPRWQPPQHDGNAGGRANTQQETTKSTESSLGMPPTNDAPATVQGGTLKTEGDTASMHKSTITNKEMQGGEMPSDLAALRTAPPVPETFLGLLSTVLAVPRRDRVSDAIWQRDWQGPIEAWLRRGDILAWIDMGHADWAWSNLEYVARYMATPGSPSWWQTKRTKPTPITARHVIESYDAQGKDAAERRWVQQEATPYLGPPLVFQAEPTTDAELPRLSLVPKEEPEPPMPPPQLQGMDEETATWLFNRMAADAPELIIDFAKYDDESLACGFAVADNHWIWLRSPALWTGERSQRQQQLYDQAKAYGRAWWDKELQRKDKEQS